MRINLVCPYALNSPGGVQNQVLLLGREYQELGNAVTIVAPYLKESNNNLNSAQFHLTGPLSSIEIVDYEKFLSSSYTPHKRALTLVIAGFAKKYKANGSVAPVAIFPKHRKVAKLIGSRLMSLANSGDSEPIVNHIHEPGIPGMNIGMMESGIPGIGTFHRSGVDLVYKMSAFLTKKKVTQLERHIAVSNAAKQTAEEVFNIKCEVFFNALDPSLEARSVLKRNESRNDGVTKILFFGRHERRKGVFLLLRALKKLFSEEPRYMEMCELLIAGDGPDTHKLRNNFSDIKSVKFLGRLNRNELIENIIASDYVIFPSIEGESFGVSLIEAASLGTPIICSDLLSYQAVLGDLGIYFKANSVSDLIRVLKDVFDNPPKVDPQELIIMSRKYSARTLAKNYVELLSEVAKSKKPDLT